MAMYESDHTRFMREWLEKHPQEKEVRDGGIALWWNQPPRDDEATARIEAAAVPRKAYYYDAN